MYTDSTDTLTSLSIEGNSFKNETFRNLLNLLFISHDSSNIHILDKLALKTGRRRKTFTSGKIKRVNDE